MRRARSARKPRTVIRKYVFFNVVQNVPPIATLNAADAILLLAALGFLGYGIQPTRGSRVGLRRHAGRLGRLVWHLVDRPLPRARDRPARDGADSARRGLERDRSTPCCGGGGSAGSSFGPPTPDGRGDAVTDGPVLSVRDLRVYYGTPRQPGARGRRRLARHRRGRGARARRRVRLREVDARPRHPRACCPKGASRGRRGALRRPQPRRRSRRRRSAGCAGPTSA